MVGKVVSPDAGGSGAKGKAAAALSLSPRAGSSPLVATLVAGGSPRKAGAARQVSVGERVTVL